MLKAVAACVPTKEIDSLQVSVMGQNPCRWLCYGTCNLRIFLTMKFYSKGDVSLQLCFKIEQKHTFKLLKAMLV